MPTKAELVAAVRTKYPGVYDGRGDDELFSAFTKKYPEYLSQVSDLNTQPPATSEQFAPPVDRKGQMMAGVGGGVGEGPNTIGFLKNMASGAVDQAKGAIPGIVNMVKHPIDTAMSIPGAVVDRVKSYASDPWGTIYNDPTSFLEDAGGAIAAGPKAAGMAARGARAAARPVGGAVVGGLKNLSIANPGRTLTGMARGAVDAVKKGGVRDAAKLAKDTEIEIARGNKWIADRQGGAKAGGVQSQMQHGTQPRPAPMSSGQQDWEAYQSQNQYIPRAPGEFDPTSGVPRGGGPPPGATLRPGQTLDEVLEELLADDTLNSPAGRVSAAPEAGQTPGGRPAVGESWYKENVDNPDQIRENVTKGGFNIRDAKYPGSADEPPPIPDPPPTSRMADDALQQGDAADVEWQANNPAEPQIDTPTRLTDYYDEFGDLQTEVNPSLKATDAAQEIYQGGFHGADEAAAAFGERGIPTQIERRGAARLRDPNNPKWESGAEPGSPEALAASKLHRQEAELDAMYRMLTEDVSASRKAHPNPTNRGGSADETYPTPTPPKKKPLSGEVDEIGELLDKAGEGDLGQEVADRIWKEQQQEGNYRAARAAPTPESDISPSRMDLQDTEELKRELGHEGETNRLYNSKASYDEAFRNGETPGYPEYNPNDYLRFDDGLDDDLTPDNPEFWGRQYSGEDVPVKFPVDYWGPPAGDITDYTTRLDKGYYTEKQLTPQSDWFATQDAIDKANYDRVLRTRENWEKPVGKENIQHELDNWTGDNPPIYVKSGGRTWIIDGHHRSHVGLAENIPINAIVVDYDNMPDRMLQKNDWWNPEEGKPNPLVGADPKSVGRLRKQEIETDEMYRQLIEDPSK